MQHYIFLLVTLLSTYSAIFSFTPMRRLFSPSNRHAFKILLPTNLLKSRATLEQCPPPDSIHNIDSWTKTSQLVRPADFAFAVRLFKDIEKGHLLSAQSKQYYLYLLDKHNVDINMQIVNKNGLISTPAGFAVFYNHLALLDFFLSHGAHAYVEDNTKSFLGLALEFFQATSNLSQPNTTLLDLLYRHNARLFPHERQELEKLYGQEKFEALQQKYPNFFITD